MKLLFLNPPKFFDTWPIPLDGVRYFLNTPSTAFPLFNRLLPEGIQSRFFDGFNERISKRAFVDLIKDQNLILMKSVNSRGALGVELAIRVIRRFNPNAKILLGGPHATAYPELWVKKGCDVVFRHESESEFTHLIETVVAGESLSDVRGITYRDKEQILSNEDAPLLESLDQSPLPDWSICNLNLYQGFLSPDSMKQKTASIESSRGCPHQCAFCFVPYFWKYRQRGKSAERMLEELDDLQARGVKEAILLDDNFGIYGKRDRIVFEEMAKRGAPILMYAFMRADSILRDPELMELYGKGGLVKILVGYESLNDEGIEKFNKGYPPSFTVEKYKEVYKITQKAGVFLYANFVVNAGQPLKEDLKILSEAEKVSDYYGTTNWEPQVRTSLENQAREEKQPIKDGFYNFIHLSYFEGDRTARRMIHILFAILTRISPSRIWTAFKKGKAHMGHTAAQTQFLLQTLRSISPSRIRDFFICQWPFLSVSEKERLLVRLNLDLRGFEGKSNFDSKP